MEKKFFSINGDINTQVYEKFLKFVDEVIRSDTKEIVIIIDSNGGEITYGFAIYDCLCGRPGRSTGIRGVFCDQAIGICFGQYNGPETNLVHLQ